MKVSWGLAKKIGRHLHLISAVAYGEASECLHQFKVLNRHSRRSLVKGDQVEVQEGVSVLKLQEVEVVEEVEVEEEEVPPTSRRDRV